MSLLKIIALITNKVNPSDFILYNLKIINNQNALNLPPKEIDKYFGAILYRTCRENNYYPNAEELQELAPEAYLKAFDINILKKYFNSEQTADIKTYLGSVLKTVTKDLIRKFKREMKTIPMSELDMDRYPQTNSDCINTFDYDDMVAGVLESFKSYPTKQGQEQLSKVFLWLLDGVSKKEIAANMNLSDSRVTVLFNIMIERLHEYAKKSGMNLLRKAIENYQVRKVSGDEFTEFGDILRKFFKLKRKTSARYKIRKRSDIESKETLEQKLGSKGFDNILEESYTIINGYSDEADYIVDGNELIIIKEDI